MNELELRNKIKDLVAEYYSAAFPNKCFSAGVPYVPVSGKVFDHVELQHLVDASLDFWLTTGRFAAQFEKQFAQLFGLKYSLLVNSGSSANLVAVSALTSPKLGDRQLKPGDEVITVAAGFPTTVNPIFQNQLVPVFVDVQIPTYNIDTNQLALALSPKTKAIVIAHTLGNPFDLTKVAAFAKQHNLWLIEDCCDAVGSKYNGQHVGTFGDIATTSFYPAHHITMGEGGAVLTNSPQLKKIMESFRDWGRDCWCEPGKDNTCAKRFGWKMGELPEGYDHKYTYSHIGYNLKVSDMQAAVGVAQLQKLPTFIEARKKNFKLLTQGLQDLQEFFILPEATPDSDPSWFGFPIAVRAESKFSRRDIIEFLEKHKIATRLLFAGNIIRQPAYKNANFRSLDLTNTDFVMNQVFWIGVYPGLTESHIAYMVEIFHKFFKT